MMKIINSPEKTSQDGFTLIEIMIAITVFAIGLLAINVMQTTSIRGNTAAKWNSLRTNLASEHLEAILNIPYRNICSDDNPLSATPYSSTFNPACTSAPGSPCAASCTITAPVSTANSNIGVVHVVTPASGSDFTGLATIKTTVTDQDGNTSAFSYIKSETDI
jgi:type IV pilus modification protein PilV